MPRMGRPPKTAGTVRDVPVRVVVTPATKAAMTELRGEESESSWVNGLIEAELRRAKKRRK